MTITKDIMARALAEKTGYYLKDIRTLLAAQDEFVKESFCEVTDDEDVVIQLVEGIKVGFKVVPERLRKNPQNQEDIVCKPTCKPLTKISDNLRETVQKAYEERKLESVD